MNFMSLLLSCREIYDKIYDGLDEKTKTKLTGGCWKLGVQRCVREDLPDEPFDCSTVDVAFTRFFPLTALYQAPRGAVELVRGAVVGCRPQC